MSKLGECLSNFVLGLKFILSIVNCALRIGGIVLMPIDYRKATSDGSDVWQISSLPTHKSEREAMMDCPKCNVRMQESEPSPLRTILSCPSCGSRIIITLTQGNGSNPISLQAKLPRDWGEFDRVAVPQAFQDAFEEVLEP
jgi:predicted RNA-binding Zn-ribbon protein involved in translation (DUF1610 family)